MERALTYVLGYLQQSAKQVLPDSEDQGQALAIKLRADNDFYSQTGQVRVLHVNESILDEVLS